MYQNTYEKLAAPFRAHPKRIAALKYANLAIVTLCYSAYPLLLSSLLLRGEIKSLLLSVLFPGGGFLLISFYRDLRNCKRPYECGIEPLVPKAKKGHSFPSRHTYSAFAIAMALLYESLPAGICFLILSALLGLIRVIEGVHFPKDVLAGAAAGILFVLPIFFI